MRLVEGSTLAHVKRTGDDYLVFLVTPRVILNLENEIAESLGEGKTAKRNVPGGSAIVEEQVGHFNQPGITWSIIQKKMFIRCGEIANRY